MPDWPGLTGQPLPEGLSAITRQRGRLERLSHLREEAGLFGIAGDLHPLEGAVDPHVDVELAGVLVEMKERLRSPREGAALALTQLREAAQLSQQDLDVIEVLVRRVPHLLSMTVLAAAGKRQKAAIPHRAR
jgi:hypothetical protein